MYSSSVHNCTWPSRRSEPWFFYGFLCKTRKIWENLRQWMEFTQFCTRNQEMDLEYSNGFLRLCMANIRISKENIQAFLKYPMYSSSVHNYTWQSRRSEPWFCYGFLCKTRKIWENLRQNDGIYPVLYKKSRDGFGAF